VASKLWGGCCPAELQRLLPLNLREFIIFIFRELYLALMGSCCAGPDLTSGKATYRIPGQARPGQTWLWLGRTADRSYEPLGSLPGGSLASPRMVTTCANWLSTKRGMRWSHGAFRIGAANQRSIVRCLRNVCCFGRAARFRSSVTRFIDPRAPHGSERRSRGGAHLACVSAAPSPS
jgi:hypothetical protein